MCSRHLWNFLLTLSFCAQASAQPSDWPQHRGPNSTGVVSGTPLLEQDGLAFSIAWKRPLGSGYSGVSVLGERGTTLYSDGEHDRLIVFEAATGATLWESALGPTYRGHHGSDDGPSSTPAITDDAVYALSPLGRLVAYRLDSGELNWERQIDPTTAPEYGFSASPLVIDDTLILQAAGEPGQTVTAYRRTDGEPVWSVGTDSTSHQNPTPMTLLGQLQLVTSDERALFSLAPDSGQVLWSVPHDLDHDIDLAQPVPYGDASLLIHSLDGATAFDVRVSGGSWIVGEAWRSRDFKRAYSMPVTHGGYVYGFSGRFLTAVFLESGESTWKSRDPGAGHLIVVAGMLAVATKDGRLVLASASEEQFVEETSIQVFDDGGETPPSFARNTFFVRNLTEMAAVSVRRDATVTGLRVETAATPPPPATRGVLSELEKQVRVATSPAEVVDRFMADQASFPVLEPGGLVHFIYRGDAQSVALKGSIVSFDPSGEDDLPLTRMPRTDLWFLSLERHAGSHWEYSFDIDYGNELPDPLNPHTVGALFGRVSELRMPEWKVPTHIEPPSLERGKIETLQFASKLRDDKRELRVYLPPDYDSSDVGHPLLLVNNGFLAHEEGLFDRTLDNLGGSAFVRPVTVFLPRSREELGGPKMEDYSRMLAEELVPFLEERFRLLPGSANRAIVGVGSGGVAAAHTVTHWPETFGKLGMQSAYFPTPELETAILERAGRSAMSTVVAYVEWSRFDIQLERLGVDAIEHSRMVAEALERSGATVTRREVLGAPGWGSWRAQNDSLLATLFPVQSRSPSRRDP